MILSIRRIFFSANALNYREENTPLCSYNYSSASTRINFAQYLGSEYI